MNHNLVNVPFHALANPDHNEKVVNGDSGFPEGDNETVVNGDSGFPEGDNETVVKEQREDEDEDDADYVPYAHDVAAALKYQLTLAKHEMHRGLRYVRVNRMLSQAHVALLAQVSQQSVSKIESHDGDPRISTLLKYAHNIGALIEIKITAFPDFDPDWRQMDPDAPTTVRGVPREWWQF